jgi:hypothetical protein
MITAQQIEPPARVLKPRRIIGGHRCIEFGGPALRIAQHGVHQAAEAIPADGACGVDRLADGRVRAVRTGFEAAQ